MFQKCSALMKATAVVAWWLVATVVWKQYYLTSVHHGSWIWSSADPDYHTASWRARRKGRECQIHHFYYTHCVFIEPQQWHQILLCLSSWLEETWCNKGKRIKKNGKKNKSIFILAMISDQVRGQALKQYATKSEIQIWDSSVVSYFLGRSRAAASVTGVCCNSHKTSGGLVTRWGKINQNKNGEGRSSGTTSRESFPYTSG